MKEKGEKQGADRQVALCTALRSRPADTAGLETEGAYHEKTPGCPGRREG